jgi:hypothetical protein
MLWEFILEAAIHKSKKGTKKFLIFPFPVQEILKGLAILHP